MLKLQYRGQDTSSLAPGLPADRSGTHKFCFITDGAQSVLAVIEASLQTAADWRRNGGGCPWLKDKRIE